jgi:hypothetical protein
MAERYFLVLRRKGNALFYNQKILVKKTGKIGFNP